MATCKHTASKILYIEILLEFLLRICLDTTKQLFKRHANNKKQSSNMRWSLTSLRIAYPRSLTDQVVPSGHTFSVGNIAPTTSCVVLLLCLLKIPTWNKLLQMHLKH